MAPRRKRLSKPQVMELITQLRRDDLWTDEVLFDFAQKVNGAPFSEPPMTAAQAKSAVLLKFGCRNALELRKDKTFMMSMTGETFALRSREDWMKLYRRWIGVPPEETGRIGPTCINGIDVLENNRPWHIFGLDSNTASKEDVKKAFKALAKLHHPDTGGDPRVFQRLHIMKDSLIALMD